MVKKKVSKKKISYNNKTIVIGVIVLVILFVLAFAYQGSREDEEGLGNIFDLDGSDGMDYDYRMDDYGIDDDDVVMEYQYEYYGKDTDTKYPNTEHQDGWPIIVSKEVNEYSVIEIFTDSKCSIPMMNDRGEQIILSGESCRPTSYGSRIFDVSIQEFISFSSDVKSACRGISSLEAGPLYELIFCPKCMHGEPTCITDDDFKLLDGEEISAAKCSCSKIS